MRLGFLMRPRIGRRKLRAQGAEVQGLTGKASPDLFVAVGGLIEFQAAGERGFVGRIEPQAGLFGGSWIQRREAAFLIAVEDIQISGLLCTPLVRKADVIASLDRFTRCHLTDHRAAF